MGEYHRFSPKDVYANSKQGHKRYVQPDAYGQTLDGIEIIFAWE